MMVLLRVARCAFWLALSVYLGGMVALGVAAPVVFRTLRDEGARAATNPHLQDASQLAGEVFGNIPRAFGRVEMIAVAVMGVAIVAEMVVLGSAGRRAWNVVRMALFAAVAGLLVYDAGVLTPAVWETRAAWRSAAGGEAEARRAEFTVLHKRSEMLAKVKVFLLAGVAIATAVGTTPLPRGRETQGTGAA